MKQQDWIQESSPDGQGYAGDSSELPHLPVLDFNASGFLFILAFLFSPGHSLFICIISPSNGNFAGHCTAGLHRDRIPSQEPSGELSRSWTQSSLRVPQDIPWFCVESVPTMDLLPRGWDRNYYEKTLVTCGETENFVLWQQVRSLSQKTSPGKYC